MYCFNKSICFTNNYFSKSNEHMNKRIKWGIIVLVGAGLTALGIHTFTPAENKRTDCSRKEITSRQK